MENSSASAGAQQTHFMKATYHSNGKLAPKKELLPNFDLEAAKDAVYIDYEGRPYHRPVLLGWQHHRRRATLIVDPLFASCSRRWRARHVTVRDHQATVLALLDMADKGRHIVSWSEHDLQKMAEVLTRSQVARLRDRYVNALAVIRPWYRKTHGTTVPGGASLSNLRAHFKYEIPDKFGDGVVGETVKSLQKRFESGLEYGDLTSEERASWVAIVKHNSLDLQHMRKILLRAIAGVPDTDLK